MKTQKREQFAYLRGRWRLMAMRAAERVGIFAPALTIALVSAAIAAVEVSVGVAGAATIATLGASALLNIVTVYALDRVRRANVVVTQITLAYLATGDRGLLDELLGRLIRGDFHTGDVQPSDQLFQTLRRVVESDDWELKRRVVEAAPALAEIDEPETLTILQQLRSDWHPRWKGDLRRRAIEAITAPGPTTGRRLLNRVSDEALRDVLRLRDDDEIWTAFAAVEAYERLISVQQPQHPELATDSRAALESGIQRLPIGEQDRQTLRDYGRAYEFAITDQLDQLLGEIETREHSAQLLERVAAARLAGAAAAHPASSAHSTRLLAAMTVLCADKERYVRRPIAREVCVRFLIDQLDKTGADVARRILLERLLLDADPIIPITTFDLIAAGTVADIDVQDAIRGAEQHGGSDLLDRARRAKRALEERADSRT